MNLKELLERKRLKPGSEADNQIEAENVDPGAADSGPSQEAPVAVQEAESPGPEPGSDMPPQEELLDTYRNLEARIAAMEEQAGAYRRILEQTGMDAQMLRKKADDETFLQSLRSQYEADPLSAINKLVERAQMELWQMMERRIDGAFRDQRNFKMLLQKFLDDPKNEGLKKHKRLVEHLIMDRGVRAEEVGAIIRDIESNSSQKSRLRAAAAKEIRNQAAVETGGEMGEPVNKDEDLDRVIKDAKTLDDLFAGLRTIKI